MKKHLGHLKARLVSEQAGQALILVLVFLLLGSLTIVPVLAQLKTGLKTGMRYQEKTNALYAADSGIEDGLWQIKYDGLQALFDGEENFNYNFTTNASYILEDPVNGLTTNVTVQNIWIPSNVTLGELGLSADDAKTIIDSEKLVVSGTAGAIPGQPYHMMIQFAPAVGDNLTIKSVGVWLPQGFAYVEYSCTLEDDIFAAYYPDLVTVTDHCGGQAIVWSYNSPYPLFTSFPGLVSENNTLTSTLEFNYTPPASDPSKMPAAIAWVTAEMADALGNPKPNPNSPVNVPISWDVDTRIYKISSKAADTKVEAYSSKRELRDLNDAISGDYVAIGNSLMTDEIGTDHIKDTLKSSSDTTLTSIPSSADVMAAYLYWSGFRYYTPLLTDEGYDFNNWTRGSVDQIRLPVSDNDTDGTWNTSPCWDDVDEASANDTDYMTGTTSGYKLFGFTPFSLPAGLPVTGLGVFYRAKDVGSSGGNNLRAYLKVNGTRYGAASGSDPGTSFTTYSYLFTTNPATGAAWTAEDLNKAGSNPLQLFGVDSTDLSPDLDVSMVYTSASDSRWTIDSGRFRGIGSASANTSTRTLTLQNGFDLSSYAPGTVAVIWNQTEGGYLEPTDTLYFAFSGDGGNTWSGNIEAFHDDNPESPFYYYVPTDYMTSNFKIRLYFNFDSADEYVYLDDISIIYMPADTSINFSINDQQVYLDASGNPQAGAQPLTASHSSVLVNAAWGGFSFACHRDVSKLVKTYPIVPGEQHHAGNAEYTVGDVQADPGQHVSYAGWSLIIIYFSPETAGHYLYLYDVFSINPQYANLDFDYDSQPGGDITGFIIPEPIRNKDGVITETVAARLTAFVGEGDDWLYGSIPNTDCVKITGQQSGNNKYLLNLNSPDNNIWNSRSYPGTSYDGVDIDTFEILWNDNIFTPKDNRVHLDMYSGQDFWNLIYFILSIRSQTTVGGTDHYTIIDE